MFQWGLLFKHNSRGNRWHSLEQIPQQWELHDWCTNHQKAKHSQEWTRGQRGSVNSDISVHHTHGVRLTLHSIPLPFSFYLVTSDLNTKYLTRPGKLRSVKHLRQLHRRLFSHSSCSYIWEMPNFGLLHYYLGYYNSII